MKALFERIVDLFLLRKNAPEPVIDPEADIIATMEAIEMAVASIVGLRNGLINGGIPADIADEMVRFAVTHNSETTKD